ncbi:unnamed protein product [Microthlaspi erraticum]|uniref:Uncharacterized protein n=1 Tax=Microthlaspi erraticum TaxID=1685480 RepID=A0A6D2KHJ9_9BRAS|nr:unnamed protein product [Microthlaspi erraticum]
MSASGKSHRGRGGKSGGVQSSSGRNSSQSSNPSTPTSTRRPLSLFSSTATRSTATRAPPQNPSVEDVNVDPQPPPQNQPPQEPPTTMTLEDLLRTPGRENYLPVLDPFPSEKTTWFDRDEGKLVRKISKLLKSKFDGAYYCWTKTPQHIKDRYFIAFAVNSNMKLLSYVL